MDSAGHDESGSPDSHWDGWNIWLLQPYIFGLLSGRSQRTSTINLLESLLERNEWVVQSIGLT